MRRFIAWVPCRRERTTPPLPCYRDGKASRPAPPSFGYGQRGEEVGQNLPVASVAARRRKSRIDRRSRCCRSKEDRSKQALSRDSFPDVAASVCPANDRMDWLERQIAKGLFENTLTITFQENLVPAPELSPRGLQVCKIPDHRESPADQRQAHDVDPARWPPMHRACVTRKVCLFTYCHPQIHPHSLGISCGAACLPHRNGWQYRYLWQIGARGITVLTRSHRFPHQVGEG